MDFNVRRYLDIKKSFMNTNTCSICLFESMHHSLCYILMIPLSINVDKRKLLWLLSNKSTGLILNTTKRWHDLLDRNIYSNKIPMYGAPN